MSHVKNTLGSLDTAFNLGCCYGQYVILFFRMLVRNAIHLVIVAYKCQIVRKLVRKVRAIHLFSVIILLTTITKHLLSIRSVDRI